MSQYILDLSDYIFQSSSIEYSIMKFILTLIVIYNFQTKMSEIIYFQRNY